MNSLDRAAGDHPPAADHHQLVGHQRHLREQVAGDEDRPALAASALSNSASTGCPAGRGRWRARRGSACAGRRAGRAASPSRWPMPSEKVFGFLRATVGQPDQLAAPRRPGWSGCRWPRPASAGGCAPCGSGGTAWPRAARRRGASAACSAVNGCPSNVVLPAPLSSPSISRIVVDLPAPLGPRNPVTLPGRTSNERSCTAGLPSYVLRVPAPRSEPWAGSCQPRTDSPVTKSTVRREDLVQNVTDYRAQAGHPEPPGRPYPATRLP